MMVQGRTNNYTGQVIGWSLSELTGTLIRDRTHSYSDPRQNTVLLGTHGYSDPRKKIHIH